MSKNIQVPQGWEVKKLGEVFKESRILGSKGDKAKKITLKLWGKGVVEKKEYIEGSATTQYYIRKEGQFIYSKLDFLNQAFAIIPKEYDGYETTIDLPCFDIDTSINPIFILEYIKQPSIYINYGKLFANGGRKARRVQVADFLNMPIPVPPLEEQKKIAEILSLWDKAIEQTKELIAYKEKQKKGLMQKFIYPIKNKTSYRIGDLFNLSRGRVISKHEIEENTGVYPVFSSQTSNNGILGYINTYDYDDELITWTTDGANAGKVFARKGKFNCTNVCGIGKPKSNNICNLIYVSAFLNNITKRYVSYVGNPKLMNNVFEEIEIFLPPLDEQKAIADILSSADEEIELLNKQLELYTEQKKGLMQNLLTGKVRV